MLKKIFWSHYTLVAALAIIFGLIMGVLLNDFPKIEFDWHLKLYEVLNLFLTFIIAISIPFFVKKWIDDKRASKIYLIDELKELIKKTSEIKKCIKDSYLSKSITRDQKDNLIMLFSDVELIIGSLDEQMQNSFPQQKAKIVGEIKSKYFLFDSFVTGDDLMTDAYSAVDNEFYRLFKEHHQKFDNNLKVSIHKVNSL